MPFINNKHAHQIAIIIIALFFKAQLIEYEVYYIRDAQKLLLYWIRQVLKIEY
jgi:hypothetical protein